MAAAPRTREKLTWALDECLLGADRTGISEAPTRCPTACTFSHDGCDNEAEPRHSTDIPRDDAVLFPTEIYPCFKPILINTWWASRRRPPSVVFLKKHLEEIKKQRAELAAPSRFERVTVRDRDEELEILIGPSPLAEAAPPKSEEGNSGSQPCESASAGQQVTMPERIEVSKCARIRGLPTPRSSLNVSAKTQQMSGEDDEAQQASGQDDKRHQQGVMASFSKPWAGAAVLPLREGGSKQRARQ